MNKIYFLIVWNFLFINLFVSGQQIHSGVFGQNAWIIPTSGQIQSQLANGPLVNHFNNNDIQSAGTKHMRFGGTEFNRNIPLPTDYQTIVVSIKSHGLIPMVQVPVGEKGKQNSKSYNATDALNILNALNYGPNASGPNGTFVEYWIVGNEPELAGWNAGDIFNNLVSIASALKNADSRIKIIGPELASYQNRNIGDPNLNFLVDKLTGGPNGTQNLTVLSNINYFSFHYYGLADEGEWDDYQLVPKRNNARDAITTDICYASAASNCSNWNLKIPGLKNNISAFQTANPGAKLAITEANICYANDVGKWSSNTLLNTSSYLADTNNANSIVGTDNALSGNGANSFMAGQFWAEIMGVCMEKGIELLNFWSVREGTSQSMDSKNIYYRPYKTDIGYFQGQSPNAGAKKPTYEHFKALATRMYGTYYPGTSNSPSDLKVFGSKNCKENIVVVIDQELSGSTRTLKISLGPNSPSGANINVKVNMNINKTLDFSGNNSNYLDSDQLHGEETMIIKFNACGMIKEMQRMRRNGTTPINVGGPYTTPNYPTCECRRVVFATGPDNDWLKDSPNPTWAGRCANPSENGSSHFNNATLMSNETIEDSAWVTGTLKVPDGVTLTIDSTLMIFATGAKIQVQPGGKLIIVDSYLTSCLDPDSTWSGIEVAGDKSEQQVDIRTSYFRNAINGLHVENSNDIYLRDNVFQNGETAISLVGCTGFSISANEVLEYTYGIKTSGTYQSTSSLSQNMFYDVSYGFYSDGDDHTLLKLECNSFSYNEYGIYCTNTDMASQGSSVMGAGNHFMSGSTNTNHEFRYTGTPLTYYSDPGFPVSLQTTGGYKATVVEAEADAQCPADMQRSTANTPALKSDPFHFDCVPNPAEDRLTFIYTIRNDVKNANVRVTNTLGKVINYYSIPPGTDALDIGLTDLSSGLYFFTLIVDGKSTASRKVVVSK